MATSQAWLCLSAVIAVGLLCAMASQAAETVPYGVGSWAEKLGNHRAVVRVARKAGAVWAHIPWRRRDAHPERKAVWVCDAKTNTRVKNVLRANISREHGDIVFEPTSGPGDYYVYYMPCRYEGSPYFPTCRYIQPRNTADASWLARHAAGKWRTLPKAPAVEIQAINEFHRFDPMEVVATAAEMKGFLEKHGGRPYVLFPEDRKYPIRMTDELPLRWVESGPSAELRGEAMRGEFYAFQVGVYAVGEALENVRAEFTDLRSKAGRTIAASAMRCVNLGGTDWLGRPFQKRVSVQKGKVQALWFGVGVPKGAAPGVYRGTIAIRPANAPAETVTLALTVSKKTAADAGDGDLWRHARLRWLDSTIGLDEEAVPPYTPVKVEGRTVQVLGRQLRFAATGLPESIQSTFSGSVDRVDAAPREVLAGPVRFVVEDTKGVLAWRGGGPKITAKTSGAVTWEAESKARGARLICHAKMEADGYVNYRLTLIAAKAAKLKDARLEIPIRRDVARYMIGMGRKGGVRPKTWDWKWNVAQANNQVWLGDVNAGLQCKLKHVTPHWNLYALHDSGIYRDWGNGGKGGCTLREEGKAFVVRAFTGPRSVAAGQELQFNFGLLATPLKVLDKAHWTWRVFHSGRARPVKEIAKTGAKIVNLHQGDALNPHINYPFRTADRLRAYVREANAKGMKVRVYYTVRELSNYCAELWALRSLGAEVFRHGPGFQLADHFEKTKRPGRPRTGSSWLCEHAVTGYVPAWHQHLGNGHYDAAIAQTGLSRWHNYYLEGLNWLIRNVGIEGLYLDGIGYDREIMKRVRKVMLRAKPSSLIDFHSGNNFHPNYGLNNVASQYMELFPYIDNLWFGEGFDYNESPDYWLVEIAGIPFGLFGEMLQGGGNPWRGMLYGMTNRLGWGGDPRAVWQLWDHFGIHDATMIGYWDPACPVKTGRKDVLATVYTRKGKTLVALASWAKEPAQCKLHVDWKTLGLSPERASLFAPAVKGFQPPALFRPSDAIGVAPGRGWLLILDEQKHEVPASVGADVYQGRKLLLDEKFAGNRLGAEWKALKSKRPKTALKLANGTLSIQAAANSYAYGSWPLPAGTTMVECQVQSGTDKGASWGPGLALVFGKRAIRIHLRTPEGRLGVDDTGREVFGGYAMPSNWHHLRVRIQAGQVIAESSHDGRWWTVVHTLSRRGLPGGPTLVRIGKTGIGSGPQDYPRPGPLGTCAIRNLRIWGDE